MVKHLERRVEGNENLSAGGAPMHSCIPCGNWPTWCMHTWQQPCRGEVTDSARLPYHHAVMGLVDMKRIITRMRAASPSAQQLQMLPSLLTCRAAVCCCWLMQDRDGVVGAARVRLPRLPDRKSVV